ncbi:MAG: hypothetical protein ABL908_02105 [Hyphomicrobium sp.]
MSNRIAIAVAALAAAALVVGPSPFAEAKSSSNHSIGNSKSAKQSARPKKFSFARTRKAPQPQHYVEQLMESLMLNGS